MIDADADLSYLHPQLRPLAVPMADLIPDPKNARVRPREAIEYLKGSIGERGFRSVLIVQKNAEGKLIIRVGNGRYQAMSELGYQYIPALVFEEGDDDAVKHAIADNRTAELAGWDFAVLGEHLSTFDDVDLATVGFTKDEVSTLLANNDWGGLELDDTPDEVSDQTAPEDGEDVGGPKHEREAPKIVVKILDATCRVELLRAIKAIVEEQYKGRAQLGGS